jgi:hypothetical protein
MECTSIWRVPKSMLVASLITFNARCIFEVLRVRQSPDICLYILSVRVIRPARKTKPENVVMPAQFWSNANSKLREMPLNTVHPILQAMCGYGVVIHRRAGPPTYIIIRLVSPSTPLPDNNLHPPSGQQLATIISWLHRSCQQSRTRLLQNWFGSHYSTEGRVTQEVE